MSEGLWRIGELSRRVGLSPQVLRAWETRYALLDPQRSPGGYRLYTREDEARVRRVLLLQAEGHSTAEAARLARSAAAPALSGGSESVGALAEQLLEALSRDDEPGAQAVLDRLWSATDLDTALVRVLLPVLARIGDRWARGETSIVSEHYASNIIQARLLRLAEGWEAGTGPRAVLACAPGELHAIGLVSFGLMLRRRGWRIAYLGSSTPVDGLIDWVDEHEAAVVVVTAVVPERFDAVREDLRRLATRARLVIGGAGASAAVAERVGAIALSIDPVAAADNLTETHRSR